MKQTIEGRESTVTYIAEKAYLPAIKESKIPPKYISGTCTRSRSRRLFIDELFISEMEECMDMLDCNRKWFFIHVAKEVLKDPYEAKCAWYQFFSREIHLCEPTPYFSSEFLDRSTNFTTPRDDDELKSLEDWVLYHFERFLDCDTIKGDAKKRVYEKRQKKFGIKYTAKKRKDKDGK